MHGALPVPLRLHDRDQQRVRVEGIDEAMRARHDVDFFRSLDVYTNIPATHTSAWHTRDEVCDGINRWVASTALQLPTDVLRLVVGYAHEPTRLVWRLPAHATTTLILPLVGGEILVRWADAYEPHATSHVYTNDTAVPRDVEVHVVGATRWVASRGSVAHLVSVEAWGTGTRLVDGTRAFENCIQLVHVAQPPDMGSVTSTYRMFSGAHVFNQDIGAWDTSSVTTMAFMFHRAFAFNHDIGAWDTSRVTNMNSMFNSANSFDHDYISAWFTSRNKDAMLGNTIYL